ncbi:TrkA C-terminal domain-containing protein [Bythopirellula goksoeyrii]|uniref:TrkA-C domain protein n=1 Tax=Bythopirellula goksoeyrii TaxID=1400387 RepID=A0A5B9QHT4_9BACT|nr:TrkA C-terminal domain-containing protein [Bythopirellula goksoeyrii]QEG33683.1 TrkA-C domain protein [Bythopirellula goksoeyrii]
MELLIPVISLPVVLALSLIIIRVGTMALMLTGLSRESARFQSHSAFTGVGFTTSEAESITQHPVRRHIVMALMIAGNVGIATSISFLMLFLLGARESEYQGIASSLIVLFASLGCLWLLASSRWVENKLNRFITLAITNFSHLEIKDYVSLLELAKGFSVTELNIEPGDWVAGKTLASLGLAREGILVLGIKRNNGDYVGAPAGNSHIHPYDTIVAYGPLKRLQELATRRADEAGDAAHKLAAQAYDEYLANLKRVDPDV